MDFLVSDGFRTTIHVGGRVLFCTLFIMMGMMHFVKLDDVSAMAASKGVPAAKPATIVGGLMILVGGVFVLLGWHRFIGAGLIAIFLFFSATLGHQFWKESDPTVKRGEMAHFMKDLALAGAALLIAFYASSFWPMTL
ncbi:MAG: DoxX family protein [Gemmatimonadetes bacterium]|nr:DoxX family protein [Gemmatimonadota bacterium]